MYRVFESALDQLDDNGFSYGHFGTKSVILTEPNSHFLQRFGNYRLPQINGNETIAADQLKDINAILAAHLPFMNYESYAQFSQNEPMTKMMQIGAHLLRTRGMKTLEERTQGDDIESIEQALGLQQTIAKGWTAYIFNPPDRLGRNLVLAKTLPSNIEYMAILNPTYEHEATNPFGDKLVQPTDLFLQNYKKAKFKHIDSLPKKRTEE